MRERKTFISLGIIVALLLLSIGYASISNITLNVSGTATAVPSQENFKVAFTKDTTYTGEGIANLEVTGNTTATMKVSNLISVGKTITAIFTIENTSNDITAYLSSTLIYSNKEYFEVTAALADTELAPVDGTTTLTVTAKLIKAPTTVNQAETINIEIIASPTKPDTGDSGGSEVEPSIISFTIDGTTYQAEEGMTWAEWVESSYNTERIYYKFCRKC